MLFRSLQVCRDLEVLGANFSASASREYLYLYTSIPKNPKNEQYLVNHLFDVIQPKDSAPWEVRELTPVLEAESKAAASNLHSVLSEDIHRFSFQHLGYGNPLYAPLSNLENLADHKTIFSYLAQIGQGDLVFVQSGASDPKAISEFADKMASYWPSHKYTHPSENKFVGGFDHRIQEVGLDGVHNVTAFRGVGFTHPDYLNYAVLEKLLGSFGLTTPSNPSEANLLQKTLGDDSNIIAVTPFNFNYSNLGLFGFYSRVRAAREGTDLIPALPLLVVGLVSKATDQEIENAKRALLTSHLLNLENKSNLLKAAAQDALYDTNWSSPITSLESVTRGSLLETLKKSLTYPSNFVTYGQVAALPHSLDSASGQTKHIGKFLANKLA